MKMARAIMRRRLFIIVPTIYGVLWIIGWILFAIAEGDVWAETGQFGVLLIAAVPVAALSTSIRMAICAKCNAKKTFKSLSPDGVHFDVQCQLEDGQLNYHNISKNKLYKVDLNTVKKVSKFKDFFVLELKQGKNIGYFIPLNSETENLYEQICAQCSALKNSTPTVNR